MALALPVNPIYYYECYCGEFRLTYFIPIKRLKELVAEGKANKNILTDFPLGVDLDCNEPDYKSFVSKYGYSPTYKPSMVCNTFLGIYSSTKNWKNFRGTGRISARFIEGLIYLVKLELEEKGLTIDEISLLLNGHTPKSKKASKSEKFANRAKLEKYLRGIEFEGVDKGKEMNKQFFFEIEIEEGKETTEQFYNRLYKSKKIGNGKQS